MIEITYRTANNNVLTLTNVTSVTYHSDGTLQITSSSGTFFHLPPANIILIRASTPTPTRRRRSHK